MRWGRGGEGRSINLLIDRANKDEINGNTQGIIQGCCYFVCSAYSWSLLPEFPSSLRELKEQKGIKSAVERPHPARVQFMAAN
ncbi:hypothetical protein Q8A67_022723 [Cirrhinus molitorella]|uniref:Uncharacterized protein n=1 Tax=Cirrhinus molitorella TaxID=172907 RepID=A0AA88P298_9TELE|nr:hypothetical protein Q8A67_022723 [Cirrhinus molitorella]